ncbi:Alpha/Beta hydrolase protein [Plectosphaerella plurivora]|uniref:Alpha/Beta hydrolase protein n=1 Tax=Plectosphaerella plurivora TaxID=936078 RepID=A0A9P8V5I2_9PEZI|nr:Alpha/Beta hydrolase protein [Plectosphaerella plurivora]
MSTPAYTVKTHVYKRVNGLDLTIDVCTPTGKESSKPLTALIFYHGVFLIFGSKTAWAPEWLIRASIRRGWTYIAPSYRLLPEATGDDVLSDTLDAAQWVAADITPRIVMTGASAGGFLAMATAVQLRSPRPPAVLAIYGMLDFSHPEYIDGSAMGAMPPLPDTVTGPVVEEITASRGVDIIDAYSQPEDMATDKRMLWVAVIKQLALFPEIITGVPGLSQKIRQSGVENIKLEHRKFFPVAFGLSEDFPPTAFVHGTADDLVEVSQSTNAAEKLRAIGVDVALERAWCRTWLRHGRDRA